MMSQNRQSAKDRLAAEIDHQVNAKAELEINNLIRHMQELELSLEENIAEVKRLVSIEKKPKKRLTVEAPRARRTSRKATK